MPPRLVEKRQHVKHAHGRPIAHKTVRADLSDAQWKADPTPTAIVVASVGGGCGLYTALLLQDALTKSGTISLPWLPPWRAHMAIACVGITTFVVSLFFLEALGRRSKQKAMKSSLPWLSVALITAAAAVVHIPIYVVMILGAMCCWWAYRRTRAIQ